MTQCTWGDADPTLGAYQVPIPDVHAARGGLNLGVSLAPVFGYDGLGSYQHGGVKRWYVDADTATTRSLADEAIGVVTTTDSSSHFALSYDLPPAPSYVSTEAEVVARSSGGACASWLLRGGFLVASGPSVSAIGNPAVVDSRGSLGGSVPTGWTATLTTDGVSSAQVRVQNANGDSVSWTARIKTITRA